MAEEELPCENTEWPEMIWFDAVEFAIKIVEDRLLIRLSARIESMNRFPVSY